MSRWPVRRAQLVAPFGVGAMTILQDGVSVIACGLDHWYKREGLDDQAEIEDEEFRFHEWRLERVLGVGHFRLPPDYRLPYVGQTNKNCRLTVPYLRFPEWHFCPACHLLAHVPSTHAGRFNCPECECSKHRKVPLLQVPFVAMCEQGHIQDFPWREWVHESPRPTCEGSMRLTATGGTSLAAQKVTCACGANRTLGRITEHSEESSYLSGHLDRTGQLFLCQGLMPWLGQDASEACSSPLKGTLRSASNVYFAQVRSAIFVPTGKGMEVEELMEIFGQPRYQTFFSTARQFDVSPDAASLRGQFEAEMEGYSDDDIESAIQEILHQDSDSDVRQTIAADCPETAFRREEFEVLRAGKDETQLVAAPTNMADYEDWIGRFLQSIVLVNKLRETRVLSGFTRVLPDNSRPLDEKKSMLWRDMPPGQAEWLPGHIVFGEGILLVLNEESLRAWEAAKADALASRLAPLYRNYGMVQGVRGLGERPLNPRFVLLHTLAHVLMNRLTFECGYSSASIRERLYVSDDEEHPMAGALIYTASGDSEGTLGGLVRMGKPGYFEPVLRRALDTAQWCSADPVCMEQGDSGGQGPDSCNLAACHNCALVPETACEEFNRFLDRGVLVGTTGSSIGFFKDWY